MGSTGDAPERADMGFVGLGVTVYNRAATRDETWLTEHRGAAAGRPA